MKKILFLLPLLLLTSCSSNISDTFALTKFDVHINLPEVATKVETQSDTRAYAIT